MAPPNVSVGVFERLREFLLIDKRIGGKASLVVRDRGRVLARLAQGVAQTKTHERIRGMGSKRRTQDCDGLLGMATRTPARLIAIGTAPGISASPLLNTSSARR